MGFIEDKIQNNRSFVEIASIFRQDFVNFPDIEFSMRKIIVRGGKNRSEWYIEARCPICGEATFNCECE